jgi:SAM-dependent methyltransferase
MSCPCNSAQTLSASYPSLLTDLSSFPFRFAHSSKDPLPTNILHYKLKQSQNSHEIAACCADSLMIYLAKTFSGFGPITGLSLKFFTGYIIYNSSHHAAHALNSLHNKLIPQWNRTFQITFACLKATPRDNNNNNAATLSNSATTNSENDNLKGNNTATIEGISFIPNVLSAAQQILVSDYLTLQHPRATEVNFGAALLIEDDKLGLKAPTAIPEALNFLMNLASNNANNTTSQDSKEGSNEGKLSDIESSSAADSPAANFSPDLAYQISPSKQISPMLPSALSILNAAYTSFNRLSLNILQPGQPIRRQTNAFLTVNNNNIEGQYLGGALMISIGGHMLLDIYSAQNDKKFIGSLYIPANSAVLFNNSARSAYSFAQSNKTKDILGSFKMKRLKSIIIQLKEINCEAKLPQNIVDLSNSEVEEKKLEATELDLAQVKIEELENTHVVDVYNAIAAHFSHTRHSPWPKVEQFVQNIPANCLVADIGCGNGKYMGLNSKIHMIGVDISVKLLEICQKKGYSVVEGDCGALPLLSAQFDYVISIALLHHIATEQRRIATIKEILRIAKPGASILLSAWALEQDLTSRRKFGAQDLLVPWNIPRKFIDSKELEKNSALRENLDRINGENGMNGDKILVQRYCHVYREGELQELFDKAGGNRIIQTYYDRGNWCIIAQKLA